jgi:hypothetical protein
LLFSECYACVRIIKLKNLIKMEKFEIHIGKIYDLGSKTETPKQTMIITSEQLAIIEQFADTRKDEDLNTIYRLNQCEFKVMPHFSFETEK